MELIEKRDLIRFKYQVPLFIKAVFIGSVATGWL